MWKYRVSFRNMINVTFVTGRRGERGGEDSGRQGDNRDSRFIFVYMQ